MAWYIVAIRALKQHFAGFGIPSIVVSDNGAQFISKEFQNFATSLQQQGHWWISVGSQSQIHLRDY